MLANFSCELKRSSISWKKILWATQLSWWMNWGGKYTPLVPPRMDYHSLGRVTDCRKGESKLSTGIHCFLIPDHEYSVICLPQSPGTVTSPSWWTALPHGKPNKIPWRCYLKSLSQQGKITKTMSLRFRYKSVHLWDKVRVYQHYPSIEVSPWHTSLPVLQWWVSLRYELA